MLRYTSLSGRHLWFDGVSSYPPTELDRQLRIRPVRFVTELTPSVSAYNKVAETPLTIRKTCELPNVDWHQDHSRMSFDALDVHLAELHNQYVSKYPTKNREATIRLSDEITLLVDCGWLELLRSMAHIMQVLASRGVVWGMGRGSIINSYVFYLLGVHSVDPIKYGLEFSELRTSVETAINSHHTEHESCTYA